VEGRHSGKPDSDWFGYTPNYLPARLVSAPAADLTNQLLQVELAAIHPDGESLVATLPP
jgi:hypothetical protein